VFALFVCAGVRSQPRGFFQSSVHLLPRFCGLFSPSPCSTANLLRDAGVLFRMAATSRVHCRSYLGVPSKTWLRLCVLATASSSKDPVSRSAGAVVQGYVSTSFGSWVTHILIFHILNSKHKKEEDKKSRFIRCCVGVGSFFTESFQGYLSEKPSRSLSSSSVNGGVKEEPKPETKPETKLEVMPPAFEGDYWLTKANK